MHTVTLTKADVLTLCTLLYSSYAPVKERLLHKQDSNRDQDALVFLQEFSQNNHIVSASNSTNNILFANIDILTKK